MGRGSKDSLALTTLGLSNSLATPRPSPPPARSSFNHHTRQIVAALSARSFTLEFQRLRFFQASGPCVSPLFQRYPRISLPTPSSAAIDRRTTRYDDSHAHEPWRSLYVSVTGLTICTRPRHDRLILRVAAPPSSRLILEGSDTVTTSRSVA
jgi:hypothetical protein